MRVRFVGDPRNGGDGPDTVILGNYEIGRVNFVDVTDEALALKLAGNSHFEHEYPGAEGVAKGEAPSPPVAAGWLVDTKRKR